MNKIKYYISSCRFSCKSYESMTYQGPVHSVSRGLPTCFAQKLKTFCILGLFSLLAFYCSPLIILLKGKKNFAVV